MNNTTFIMKNKIQNQLQLKTIQKSQIKKYLKKRKNRKMIEKFLPQKQVEKSEHKELSRLRNQPRKNYKTFIPQSKILKKLNFKNNFIFKINNPYTSGSY